MQGDIIHYYRDGNSFLKVLRFAKIENGSLIVREDKNLPITARISLSGITLETYHDKSVNEHWINIHRPDLSVFYMIVKDKKTFDDWFRALEISSRRRQDDIGSSYMNDSLKTIKSPNEPIRSLAKAPELPPRSRSVSRNSSTFKEEIFNTINPSQNTNLASMRNLTTIRETNSMPREDILKTDRISDIRKRYPVSGLAKRMSISASDFIGKSRDELIILLLQLNREKANLSRWKEYFENEIDKIESSPNPGPSANDDIKLYKKELEDVNGQLRLTKPLVSFLEKITTLGDMYAGNDAMFATEYRKEYVPTKSNIEFIRKNEERETDRYITERINKNSTNQQNPDMRNIIDEEISAYRDRRLQLEEELENLNNLFQENLRRRNEVLPYFKNPSKEILNFSNFRDVNKYETTNSRHRSIPNYRKIPRLSHNLSRSNENFDDQSYRNDYQNRDQTLRSSRSSRTITPIIDRIDSLFNDGRAKQRYQPTPDPLQTLSGSRISSRDFLVTPTRADIYADPWDMKKSSSERRLSHDEVSSQSTIKEVYHERNPAVLSYSGTSQILDSNPNTIESRSKDYVKQKLNELLQNMPLEENNNSWSPASQKLKRAQILETEDDEEVSRIEEVLISQKTRAKLSSSESEAKAVEVEETATVNQPPGYHYTKNTRNFSTNNQTEHNRSIRSRSELISDQQSLERPQKEQPKFTYPQSIDIDEGCKAIIESDSDKEMKEIREKKAEEIRKNIIKMSLSDSNHMPALYRIELDTLKPMRRFRIIDERIRLLDLKRKIAQDAAKNVKNKSHYSRSFKLDYRPLPDRMTKGLLVNSD